MDKWKINYEYAKKYYEEKGHLLIPRSYKIDDINLGNWINSQRIAYKDNKLSEERKKLLEYIGMIWDLHEYNWNINYAYAKKYYEEKGHLLIPRSYKIDDINLGTWISDQRTAYKNKKLSEKRKKSLEDIGMVWQVREDIGWEETYEYVKKYYEENEHLLIPRSYKIDDINLGTWISSQRIAYKDNKLLEERKKLLEDIGMVWQVREDIDWEEIYEYAKKYYEEKGHLLIPRSYKIDDINLGTWISNQRTAYKNNQLSEERKKLLEDIEMVWDLREYNWEETYEYAKKYYEEKGHLLIPQSYKIDDINLGTWISNQRTAYKNNQLSEERKKLLEDIGMVWDLREYNWEETYEYAKKYYEENEHLLIPLSYKIDDINLGTWISDQRKEYKNNQLSEERKNLLEYIGMVWDLREYNWNINYAYAKKYYEEKGHLLIPQSYKIDDINLGTWISDQRIGYKNNQLSEERKKSLEDIGMIWDLREYNWEETYEYAKKYYEENEHLLIPLSYKIDDINLGTWISNQRKEYKNNQLSEERKKLLEDIGMVWNVHKYKFLYGEVDNKNKRYFKINLLKYVENILKKQDQQSLFESKQDINEINDKLILELK